MRKIQRRHRVFWVGSLPRQGSQELGLVVFDPSSQPDFLKRTYVDLFEAAENTMGQFRREVVRGLIGSPDSFSEDRIQAAIDHYCQAVGLDLEAEWAKLTNKEHESICWKCWRNGLRMLVDSRIHSVCSRCGWVQCPRCGACRDPKYGSCEPAKHG